MRSTSLLCLLIAAGALGCGAAAGPAVNAPQVNVPALAEIKVGQPPILLALAADGSRLYATGDDGKLVVIDTSSNQVLASFDVPPNSVAVAVSPDGRRVYVSNLFGNTLTVLDTTKPALLPALTLVAQFRRGGYGRMAISPDGSKAYVVNRANEAFLIVDLNSGQADVKMMDMRPVDVALTPSGDSALICGCKDFCVPGTCEPFDAAQGLFGGYLSVGGSPYRVVIDSRGVRAFVAALADSTVTIVDLVRRESTAKLTVPVQPTGLALSSDGGTAYVASQTSGTVTAIDAASASVRAIVRVAEEAREIVVMPDGARAYVSTKTGVIAIDTRAFGN